MTIADENLIFAVNSVILIASILLLLGIASSKFSARLGMPVLVLFLGLGMLAGSEGIGGIAFENYSVAYTIGTLGLVIILFSGGLSTPYQAVRLNWKPAGILATWGVLWTALITGLATMLILDIPLLQGLLLGSIVSSTDASAVFSVLRTGGVHLRRRLSDTLEVESGSNDPMAIFLTVGLVEVLTGNIEPGPGLLWLFVNQMGIGLAIGILLGQIAVALIRRINLQASGLYPILATSFGLLSFGLAAILGGSGFLAVYLTGLVIGNNRIVFQKGVIQFHDAAAWMAQIVMFVVLGLLSFPSRLLSVFLPGLAIAAVLLFVARPVAVALSLWRSSYSGKEQLFLSWVGLKGAVPITLAIFPLLADVERANVIFDVVFFVVLISATLQGWTLPWVARRLGLEIPAKREAPVTLEISSLRDVEGDIVDYFVDEDSRAAGKLIRELAFPEEVVVALIVRDHHIRLPKGSFQIDSGDHVIVVMRPHVRAMVDRIFSKTSNDELEQWPAAVEFPMRAAITIGEIEQFYDIKLGEESGKTLAQWICDLTHPEPVSVGTTVQFNPVALRVVDLDEDGKVRFVGMSFIGSLAEPSPVDTKEK